MGIWLIKYELRKQAETEYLDWFHNIHIAEKLARPGYTWAAHYRISDNNSGAPEFIALFGGTSSRVFYDPSPLQIKPNQDELTRKMMGYRVNPHMQILTHEWSESRGESELATTAAIQSPAIALWLFGQPSVEDQHKADVDQILSSWCTQQFFKSQLETTATTTMHKPLASTGSPRHAVLQEFSSAGSEDKDLQESLDSWMDKKTKIELSAIQAERCWPAVDRKG